MHNPGGRGTRIFTYAGGVIRALQERTRHTADGSPGKGPPEALLMMLLKAPEDLMRDD